MKTVGGPSMEDYRAVGTAPKYSRYWQDRPIMHYHFRAWESTYRAGWGRLGFGFEVGTFPLGNFPEKPEELPFPAQVPKGEQQRSFDLRVTCPNDKRMMQEYPSRAALQDAQTAIWQITSDSLTDDNYSGSCENAEARFWVDHATDGLVLGLGVLLSVLVAFKSKPDSAGIPEPSPLPTASLPPERRQRHLWAFLLPAVWLLLGAWRHWRNHAK
jgi:hypothetical protein